MTYTAEGKYATEEEAKTDLDTCGYAGKWKSAKEGVAREKPALDGAAYWDAVRLYFLELGGCWLTERCAPAPTAEPVATLANGKPVGMSYTEWMLGGMPHPPVGGPLKVREG